MMVRKPDWLRKPLPETEAGRELERLLAGLNLATVCRAAACPNRNECFSLRRAAFLALGPVCTRRCAFCRIEQGAPAPVDPKEARNIALAARALGLRHAVVTSVTRDDLSDGGAAHFRDIIRALKNLPGPVIVEVLVPDFGGRSASIRTVAEAGAEIINHNIETVPRFYPAVRPQADYRRSLELLAAVKRLDGRAATKSGMMLGLGEQESEVIGVFRDLRGAGCDLLTLGQYLAPSRRHYPVAEFITPDRFEQYRTIGLDLGFRAVSAGPFVRSSYHAEEVFLSLSAGSINPAAGNPNSVLRKTV